MLVNTLNTIEHIGTLLNTVEHYRMPFNTIERYRTLLNTSTVINIYCLQCAFMQNKSKETNKKSKSLIFYVNWLKLGQLKSLYLDYDSFQLGKIFVVKPG